jgi:hypothetical protein
MESLHRIEKFESKTHLIINEQIRVKWLHILDDCYEIYVSDFFKPDNGNLGITLEGTTDTENGEEIDTHHYIGTLLSDGIIGKEGTLKPGDELLEVKSIYSSF